MAYRTEYDKQMQAKYCPLAQAQYVGWRKLNMGRTGVREDYTVGPSNDFYNLKSAYGAGQIGPTFYPLSSNGKSASAGPVSPIEVLERYGASGNLNTTYKGCNSCNGGVESMRSMFQSGVLKEGYGNGNAGQKSAPGMSVEFYSGGSSSGCPLKGRYTNTKYQGVS